MPVDDSATAVETVFRMEFPRVVAVLVRATGSLDLAEELAQDALVDALRQWPHEGAPSNPGAWLTAVAKRKAIDRFRRDRTRAGKYAEMAGALRLHGTATPDDAEVDIDEDTIEDDRLRVIFVACHPVLAPASRAALTLRLVGGLTTIEIARAYVVPERTIAQRIVRAKKAIARAGVAYEVPQGEDRAARLGSVLEVVYLIFNEGYAATTGEHWLRPELCGEALRLGRSLAALMPEEAEVHGLVALMEFQSSRLRARVGPAGEPVLLADQDRRHWDTLHISRGESALTRATELSSAPGPYALQAAIAACHTRAFRPEETDWDELVRRYETLAAVMPSPIVELNRAVAVSMASGPGAALPLVEDLGALGVLERYHLLHSVRGDLLDKLGRFDDAAESKRIFAEGGAHPVVAGGGRVALVEDQIDDLEHRRQPRLELGAARHLERHLGVGERALGAHDPLLDRRLGGEKAARNLVGRESAEQAQRERDARFRREDRMARDEHEAKQIVADVVVDRRVEIGSAFLLLPLQLDAELLVLSVEHLATTELIDGATLGGVHEPRARVIWDSRLGPLIERREECVLREVLGQAHVAGHAREPGNQPGRFDSPDRVDCSVCVRDSHAEQSSCHPAAAPAAVGICCRSTPGVSRRLPP